MIIETKTELNAAKIKEIVKEGLPPEEEVRKMIGNYKSLTEKEKLIIDRHYFLQAANVTDNEANKFYFFLKKGARVHPGMIDEEHPVFCPIWRMRLALLGEKAQKDFLYVIWGESP